MKDNFSSQSDKYAKYRPSYPSDFYDYLNLIVPNKQHAWDCGTGNGQVALELSKTFNCVLATDISQSQIDNALQADNIQYSVQAAERTNFEDNLFDLIITAQAIHWFDFNKFYGEVIRTSRKNAIMCAIGYGRIEISKQIDHVITNFYKNIIGLYWDKERKYIDQNYRTIPFPFKEIQAPNFAIKLQWDIEHLIGYLNTWSAVQHFIRQNNYNPIEQIKPEIEQLWGKEQTKQVRFPLLLRVGQIS